MDTSKMGSDVFLLARRLKINGIVYDSVGVKYKGTSSYDSANVKNPLHIELNTFKNQTHQGYADLKLSTNLGDPSMLREVLGYHILGNYMHCSKANFAQVYINGKYMGVYANTESVNKKFCKDHFFSSTNAFFKCDVFPDANDPAGPFANVPGLKYAGADSLKYDKMYEIKSKYGWKDLRDLTDSLTNRPASANNVFDMDRAIWMLAYNDVVVNLDSYIGFFPHNYYVYKDNNGRFNPIIWDLNNNLGGNPIVEVDITNPTPNYLTVKQMQELPLVVNNKPNWVLTNLVMSNPQYKRMYMAHAKTINNEMFNSGAYLQKINALRATIDTAILSDPNKFYTYQTYRNSVDSNLQTYIFGPQQPVTLPGLKVLFEGRRAFLNNTTEFNAVAPTITNIIASVSRPTIGSTFRFTAKITVGAKAWLSRRGKTSERFLKAPMYDDGAHGDGMANDGTFGTDLLHATSLLMEYYVYAENNNAGIFSPQRAEHEFHTLAGTTATAEIITEPIKMYPNPTDNTLNITFSATINPLKVEILTILGSTMTLLDATAQSTSLDVSHFPTGLYLVKFTDDKGRVKVDKFVKN